MKLFTKIAINSMKKHASLFMPVFKNNNEKLKIN